MKKYDICVFFAADYMSGSAYDAFEYYQLIKKYGHDSVCLVLLLDIPKLDVIATFKNRYVWDQADPNIFIFSYTDPGIIKIKSKVTLITSIFSLAQLINRPILMPTGKIFVFHETTFDSEIFKVFDGKWIDKITMLRDDRCFGIFEPYKHITYKKKLYFDIFKPIKYPVRNCCLINMATHHKCLSADKLKEVMAEFDLEYLIYTQENNYFKYIDLISDNVEVQMAPIKNYLDQFNTFMYFQSIRGQDPSPRILPECVYYGKQIIFYDWDKTIKDGAHYRRHDCLHDWNSIVLSKNDQIFDII